MQSGPWSGMSRRKRIDLSLRTPLSYSCRVPVFEANSRERENYSPLSRSTGRGESRNGIPMRKIFVTGGAGFIGSAFLRQALQEIPSCTLTNFDALTYAGNLDNLEGLDACKHRFIHGDITDRQAVLAALEEGTDAIIHLAAESHVDRSIASADAFLRTNVLGTQVLLDAASERRVRRFVHVSTDEVMGSLPEDDEVFFTESSPFAPNSPYAASKAAAEHLVRAAHHT